MKPVYQTIFGKENGNCLQAVVASVLELPLDEVPHFISFGDEWLDSYREFMLSKGFDILGMLCNPKDIGQDGGYDFVQAVAQKGCNFNGLYIATVYSPKHCNLNAFKTGKNVGYHAVVVDLDLNIVHEPNLAYKGVTYPLSDLIGYNGLVSVEIFKPTSHPSSKSPEK